MLESDRLDSENPWPGLRSFTEAAHAFFFGREEEIRELLRLVRRRPLAVLFGRSGLGKSSLLQAGLFPRLRGEHFLPVYIRLEVSPTALPLVEQVKAKLAAEMEARRVSGPRPRAEQTLWGYFHRVDTAFHDAEGEPVVPVLVFDQFEEIFTLDRGETAERRRLIEQLADLIENRMPRAVQAEIEANDERTREYEFDQENCRIVFSFREDYLPDFEGLRRDIPSIMENRKRLRRMSGLQARDVILKPGRRLVAGGVASKIVLFVSARKDMAAEALEDEEELRGIEVEPALLSIVCREINNKRLDRGQQQITADLLDHSQEEIISDFYLSNVADVPESMKSFIEDKLLTKGGYRDSRPLEEALELGLSRELVNTLVERRLLRLEERSGRHWVELAHDRLTDVVAQRRLLREEQARQLAQHRARQRRVRRIAAIVACAVVGVLAVGGTLYWQQVREHQEANRDRDRLFREITTIINGFGDNLVIVPGTLDVISKINTDTRNFAEAYAADSGSDPAIIRLSVTSLILNADIDAALGKLTRSREDLDQAARKLDQLAKDDAATDETQSLILALKVHQGLANRLRGDYDHSLEAYGAAVELARGLRLKPAFAADASRQLSTALGGEIEADLGKATKAAGSDPHNPTPEQARYLAAAQEALEARTAIVDAMAAQRSDDVSWQIEHAILQGNRASLALQRGDYDGAINFYRDERRELDQLQQAQTQNHVRSSVYLAYVRYLLGRALLLNHDYAEARPLFETSVDYFDNLHQLDPNTYYWVTVGALIREQLGDLMVQIGERSQALDQYRMVLAARRAIQALDPQNDLFQAQLKAIQTKVENEGAKSN